MLRAGSGCSKTKNDTDAAEPSQVKIGSPSPEQAAPGNSSDSKIAADLSSYEAACSADPALQTFDRSVRARTTRAINSLANGGVEIHKLSFDSLKEVIGCLVDVNQDVVKIIMNSMEDIWNNKDLSSLVEGYFDNSIQTLNFCAALENCLKRARRNQLMIRLAVQQFQDEVQVQYGVGEKKFVKTLDELSKFKASEEPFNEEFFEKFESLLSQQKSFLNKLQEQKRKLDKKLKSSKRWRTVSNALFMAAFVSVLICSVVAAAIAAPPVITAIAGGLTVPIGSLGKWCSWLWNRYESTLKGQKGLYSYAEVRTNFVIMDMKSINVLVSRMEIQIDALLKDADFALKEREKAVKLVIDEMKKKLDVFMETIENLEERAEKCRGEITVARKEISQRILEGPPGSQTAMEDACVSLV